MKNLSQESQNNFDGDPRDNSDMTLVNFLKQNKLIAPPPAPNFEQQLFAEISKYPQRKTNKNFQRWQPWLLAIPVAIAAGFAFNWATNRSQMQIAINSNQSLINSPMSESDKAAIEQSLISSWTVTDDVVYQATATSSEAQILTELTPLEYE
ncbi:hypothetical protein H6F42_15470 [Pseudanabaena sp. FACHB-1998]|uniref:hypothetical protein n=1 Tax=Pseudanabaena sp. FACHB-1998 TaxID=2692858 RepID=UPI0016810CDB|nr:hypothetical protein [Pseudanabaena sp. FACHB-1998]MBD2178317.1 hypothetical protein [Pseudanabaena sp. FACHB-1998]